MQVRVGELASSLNFNALHCTPSSSREMSKRTKHKPSKTSTSMQRKERQSADPMQEDSSPSFFLAEPAVRGKALPFISQLFEGEYEFLYNLPKEHTFNPWEFIYYPLASHFELKESVGLPQGARISSVKINYVYSKLVFDVCVETREKVTTCAPNPGIHFLLLEANDEEECFYDVYEADIRLCTQNTTRVTPKLSALSEGEDPSDVSPYDAELNDHVDAPEFDFDAEKRVPPVPLGIPLLFQVFCPLKEKPKSLAVPLGFGFNCVFVLISVCFRRRWSWS